MENWLFPESDFCTDKSAYSVERLKNLQLLLVMKHTGIKAMLNIYMIHLYLHFGIFVAYTLLMDTYNILKMIVPLSVSVFRIPQAKIRKSSKHQFLNITRFKHFESICTFEILSCCIVDKMKQQKNFIHIRHLSLISKIILRCSFFLGR